MPPKKNLKLSKIAAKPLKFWGTSSPRRGGAKYVRTNSRILHQKGNCVKIIKGSHRSKPQKNPEKNIGSNHILVKENFSFSFRAEILEISVFLLRKPATVDTGRKICFNNGSFFNIKIQLKGDKIMTKNVDGRAKATEEIKELMLFVELGDESRTCSLIDKLTEKAKIEALETLLYIYKNRKKSVSGNAFPKLFGKTIKLIEDMLDAKKMPIDLLLEVYKCIGNVDLCFSGWHRSVESVIADFIPFLSLEKLVKVFEYIPSGELVGIMAHNSFKWSSVRVGFVSRKQCRQIVKLICRNEQRMYIVHEMLRNNLVSATLTLSMIRDGLQKSGELPLGTDWLIKIIAEMKIDGSKAILLKAVRKITSSNYIGQDEAARKIIQHLDLTNTEIAELVRDLIYLSEETSEIAKEKIGMLPIDAQVNLLAIGKHHMIDCLIFPNSTTDLIYLVRECKKLCDSKAMDALKRKLSPEATPKYSRVAYA